MFNIRYGIKFMTEHVVFMSAADTTNDVMHFYSESWSETMKTRYMKETNVERET